MLTEASSKIIISSQTDNIINADKSSPKKRSWVEMAIDDDYEEQEKIREQKEKIRELYEKCRLIMEIRKFLFSIGEYEAEEGEVFE
jgi:hypothetical protein